jgi:hypothetical protein
MVHVATPFAVAARDFHLNVIKGPAVTHGSTILCKDMSAEPDMTY